MNIIKLILTIILGTLLFTVPTYLSLYRNSTTAIIFMLSTTCAISLVNHDKISLIQLAFLKLKLKEKIKEADHALLEIKKLAKAVGESTISLLACSQLQGRGLTKTYAHALVSNIYAVMDGLDLKLETDSWHTVCLSVYIANLITKKHNMWTEAPTSDYQRLVGLKFNTQLLEEVEVFVTKHNLKYDKKDLNHTFYFIKKQKHKNEKLFMEIFKRLEKFPLK